MADESLEKLNFLVGSVYETTGRGSKLMRLICEDVKRKKLLFKVVAKKWRRDVREAEEMDLENGLSLLRTGAIRQVPDTVRPGFMNLSDWELKERSAARQLNGVSEEEHKRAAAESAEVWLAKRDRLYDLIAGLVTADAIAATYAPVTSREVLLEHCVLVGVNLQFLRRILHKFAWFGMDKNSLLELRPSKGATGGTRLSGSTRGAKSDAQKLLGDHYATRPVNGEDVKRVELVLRASYVKKWRNMTECYEDFQILYYTENQFGFYQNRPRKVPSYEQFRYHAKKLINSLQLEKLRTHHSDKEGVVESRGVSWDLAPEAGDMFDTDATEFNKELIDSLGAKGVAVNVGKATVILVVDRRSKKIVGWHVNLEPENWAEGYRLALYCAFTSKTAHLKYLDIDAPDAFPDEENIVCRAIYSDGGPASSAAERASYARLRIDFVMPGPAVPEGKGDVEGSIGLAQKDQAGDPGGYQRTNQTHERQKRRLAKLLASEDVYQLERKLVQFIIRKNAAHTRAHLLTAEMKSAEHRVEPSSNAIFSWSLQKMGGVRHRVRTDVEIFTELLNHVTRTVTREGVNIEGNVYNSEAMRRKFTRSGASFSTKIYFTASRPEVAYWVTDEGQMDALQPSKNSTVRNGRMTFEELKFEAQVNRARAKIAQEKSRKKGAVTQAMLELMTARLNRVNRIRRKKPTASLKDFRRVANAIAKSERPMDQDPVALLLRAKEEARRKARADAAEAAHAAQRSVSAAATAASAPAPAAPAVASAPTAVPTEPAATPPVAPVNEGEPSATPGEAARSKDAAAVAPESRTPTDEARMLADLVAAQHEEARVGRTASTAQGAPASRTGAAPGRAPSPSPAAAAAPAPAASTPSPPAAPTAVKPMSAAERFLQKFADSKKKP